MRRILRNGLYAMPVLLIVGCTSLAGESTITSSIATATIESPGEVVVVVSPEATSPPTATATDLPPTDIPSSPTPSVFEIELPLGEGEYVIPLNIRHVSPESATLFFELEEPAEGVVSIRSRESGGQPFTIPLDPGNSSYLLTAHNLVPGERYDVVVAVRSQEGEYLQPGYMGRAWGPVSFQTRDDDEQLRIGVIGDASFGDDATTTLIGEMAEAELDFVIHTGDVVDNRDPNANPYVAFGENYYIPFEPLLVGMPVYTVPGNHDYDQDIRFEGDPFYYYAFPPFFDPQLPGQEYADRNQFYAVPYGDIQFVMLDTQALFGQPGRDEQETWLDQRLADPDFEITIPVFHVAPYNSSTVHPDDSKVVRGSWVSKFEEASVPMTLSGHFHTYERLEKNDIVYIISSGGSKKLYAKGDKAPESKVYKRESHYLLMELDRENISFTAISIDGDILDQVAIPLE